MYPLYIPFTIPLIAFALCGAQGVTSRWHGLVSVLPALV